MNQRLLRIVLIVVILLIVAGVAALYLVGRQDQTGQANSTTGAANGNSGSPTSNINVTIEPFTAKGDKNVEKSVTWKDRTLTISTAQETTSLHRRDAAKGEKFVVLFLKPFTQDPPANPVEWGAQEIRLRDGKGESYVPFELSIPSAANTPGGYLWFRVPDSTKGFSLVLGTGADAAAVTLGF